MSGEQCGFKMGGEWRNPTTLTQNPAQALSLNSIVTTSGHPEILQLAGQGVAAPAEKVGGVSFAAGGVFERGFNQCPFKGRDRFAEQLMMAAGQCLVCPVTQGFFPVVSGGAAFFVVEQLRWQVFNMNFTA